MIKRMALFAASVTFTRQGAAVSIAVEVRGFALNKEQGFHGHKKAIASAAMV
ncbi:MAG: hypothetical protein RL392_605 [Pseudomonadota bacterium]|jgi:hypothetical protein